MFSMFFRPKPEFRVNILVNYKTQYMFIKTRSWFRLKGEQNKQWVYSGFLIEVVGGRIKVSTYISCVKESDIGNVAVG